jgi:hypothetical protein
MRGERNIFRPSFYFDYENCIVAFHPVGQLDGRKVNWK